MNLFYQKTNPHISIIIVSWNVRELLRANLANLTNKRCSLSYEIFVVDNGSSDGSAAMVREEFPHIKLIQNDWDAGFARSNNQALRLAKGEVILLLNPDMLVGEGTLEKTYHKLTEDYTIGVLGVKLISSSCQTIQSVRRFPTFLSQVAIMLKLQHFFPKLISFYMADDFDYSKSQEVDQVRGSYFAFRRSLLDEVGFLDEKFHLWFEEVDYCYRVKAKGYRVFYLADVSCRDYVGKGFTQMKHFQKQKIFTASMIYYFRKYHPIWQVAVLIMLRPIALTMALLADSYSYLRKNR